MCGRDRIPCRESARWRARGYGRARGAEEGPGPASQFACAQPAHACNRRPRPAGRAASRSICFDASFLTSCTRLIVLLRMLCGYCARSRGAAVQGLINSHGPLVCVCVCVLKDACVCRVCSQDIWSCYQQLNCTYAMYVYVYARLFEFGSGHICVWLGCMHNAYGWPPFWHGWRRSKLPSGQNPLPPTWLDLGPQHPRYR